MSGARRSAKPEGEPSSAAEPSTSDPWGVGRAENAVGAVGRARVHRQPGRRPLFRPDRPLRTPGSNRGSRPLRRTRDHGVALSGAVGAGRSVPARPVRLALDRCAAWTDAGAGLAADRRPRAPRQRPPLHQPSRRQLRPVAGGLRPGGGRALSVGGGLDAGQRARDHGAVLRALRSLVPAPRRRAVLLGGAAERDRRHPRSHARDPQGQPGGATGPDRGPGLHLRDPGAGASERFRQRATMDELGPADGPGHARTPLVRASRLVRLRRPAPRDRRRSVPAGRDRGEPLPHQRPFPGPQDRPLSARAPGRQRVHDLRRRGGDPGAAACAGRAGRRA